MKLLFASHNKNKLIEIAKLLPKSIDLLGLHDFNDTEDIAETGLTLEENALLKARHVHTKFQLNCFADDSGLEIEALNNAPGVYSARYASTEKNDTANIEKVLVNLKNEPNRKAQFRTVIALIIENKEILFEGIIKGTITKEKRGTNGFGYDPIFVPDGFIKTFGEFTLEEKNKISHRALAIQKLTNHFLKQG